MCSVCVFMFDHTMHVYFIYVCVCFLLVAGYRLVRKPTCCHELIAHRQSFVSLSPVSPALCNWFAFLPWQREPSGVSASREQDIFSNTEKLLRTEWPTRIRGCTFPVLRAEKQSCLGNTNMGSKHSATKYMSFNSVLFHSSLPLD